MFLSAAKAASMRVHMSQSLPYYPLQLKHCHAPQCSSTYQIFQYRRLLHTPDSWACLCLCAACQDAAGS